MFGPPKAAKSQPILVERAPPKSEKLNLTHQFISLLLVILVEAGLIEVRHKAVFYSPYPLMITRR